MVRTNRRTRGLMLWVLLIAGGTAAGAAQQAAADPLQLVPPESLFCVKINDLDATLGKLDQFLTGLAPFNPSMMVKSQLAQLLGSADANSIDMSGDFAVFGLLPGGEKPSLARIGVLIPVTSYQKFVESNTNVTPPNAQGISRIGPEGEQKMVAAGAGGFALVTAAGNEQALTEMKSWLPRGATSLANRLSPEESKRAENAPAWAYANIQAVYKMFGPAIQAKMKEAEEHFKQMQTQTQGMAVMGDMDAVVKMYTTILDSLMQETQSVSLSLDPSASAIRAGLAVASVPNTDMAKILSEGETQGQRANLIGYLQNGALMNFVATPGQAFIKAITLKRVELLTTMSAQALSQEDIAKLKKLAMDSADAFAGPMAMSLSSDLQSKPPMKMRYVAVLKDKQKFNSVMDEVARMAHENAFANLMESFGVKMQFEIKRNAETYKNVPIDALHLSMQAVDANAPQGQMLAAMFGQGLDLRLAVVNDLMLYTLSPQPQKAIQALIDQAQAGGTTQAPSELQAALQLIPGAQQAEFFGTYNYPRAVQMAMAFMPMPMPQVQLNTQSNIAFDGDIGGGRFLFNAAVPKQQVLETMMVFMQVQQSMQGQQEQQGQQDQK